MGEKCFLVWVTYYDGIHEHSYRGLMRGKSEEDVCERAHEKAVPHFGFFEYRPGGRILPTELEDEKCGYRGQPCEGGHARGLRHASTLEFPQRPRCGAVRTTQELIAELDANAKG